ncbi:hypothetical protein [Streptomyces erythrochromogenes]|uniref:hypothetical protein n=1 Tax=Streptomyces erythrochromogenes TaxID=285574 RepID=UPI0004CD00C7|nr:hypothetical protein [Streptomyces erythrochromogenes]MCX5586995.1 hypothetical protein [Streptomyces erythrochromogenes]
MSPATEWAVKTFGAVAGQLAETVPACLVEAHARARHAHEGVHTQTLEAYGHGLHAAQYEALAAGLTPLEGVTSRRLQGRTVMLIGSNAIYPIRYAKKDVPVTEARLRKAAGFRADLIRRHGPEPMQQAFDLGLDELDEEHVHPDVALLPPDLRLVIVAYACSMERGVMRIEWGSAELRREDRYLVWHHHEPLLPPATPRAA